MTVLYCNNVGHAGLLLTIGVLVLFCFSLSPLVFVFLAFVLPQDSISLHVPGRTHPVDVMYAKEDQVSANGSWNGSVWDNACLSCRSMGASFS